MDQRVVVMNAGKMNYDGSMDFSCLSADTVVYDATAPEEFLPRIQGAAAIVTKELPVPADLIAQFPDSVKLICEAGTGYNNIDIAAARAKGITVTNIPAYSSQRVAQTAIMFLLNLSSTMQTQIRMLERGDRRNFTEHILVPHLEVNGKTIGLVGCGNIGNEVKKVALALGMKVLIHKRHPGRDEENVKYVDLDTLLAESDYVSLHCPLTPQTKHIIDGAAIEKMKPTAFMINTSRGALIDEPALIKALKAGRIAGAGLDVQETEPPAQDNPLYTLENVILTPHMGWKGYETRQRLLGIIRDDVQGFFNGTPVNVVS
ncbi:MAG: D-2-hydroxyacid dehydrogenase [Lachnospiraceae bacterium]|nr:D-2-hydroxyacid dehydrogenase [Lachnospiraceae bacterium]